MSPRWTGEAPKVGPPLGPNPVLTYEFYIELGSYGRTTMTHRDILDWIWSFRYCVRPNESHWADYASESLPMLVLTADQDLTLLPSRLFNRVLVIHGWHQEDWVSMWPLQHWTEASEDIVLSTQTQSRPTSTRPPLAQPQPHSPHDLQVLGRAARYLNTRKRTRRSCPSVHEPVNRFTTMVVLAC